jgi:hypothetical protein
LLICMGHYRLVLCFRRAVARLAVAGLAVSMWASIALVMARSDPRASCWQMIAARSLSGPIGAIRSFRLAPLAATHWFPVPEIV